MHTSFLKWLALLLTIIFSQSAYPSDFGGIGLIDIPTARMAPDGEITASISHQYLAAKYALTYQVMPRVESTFRYTVFNPRKIRGSVDELKDRSYEVKALISKERRWFPAVAIGVRDILGTGAWASEYVVGSKRFGRLDASLGIGWGRFAGHGSFDNPLSVFGDDWKFRESAAGGSYGGEIREGTFFKGKTAIFGGLKYRIPRWGIDLLAEYNSDRFLREQRLKSIDSPSPYSFGIEWHRFPQLTLGISWQHGDQFGFSIAANLNSKNKPKRQPQHRYYSSRDNRSKALAPTHLDLNSWYDRALYDFERSGLKLQAARLEPGATTAVIEIENEDYGLYADAVERALTLSEIHMPSRVSRIEVLLRESDMLAPSVHYLRAPRASLSKPARSIEDARELDTASKIERITIAEPKKLVRPTNSTDYELPRVAFGADLAARTQLMDPDDPLRYQLYAKLSARLLLAEGLNVWFSYGVDLYNDFSTQRESDSVLPKVRSEINRYLTEGASGIHQFYVEKRGSLSTTLHYRAFGGILEEMFSGFGGEMLYQPYLSRWAIGVDIASVKRRDYAKTFDHLEYEAVTHFVSLYYASPFFNMDAAVHLGKYLAGDEGYTIEARRTFDNGFSVGLFMTRTNVSAEEFGEGSFDKGIYFRLPFDGILPGNTRGSYSTILRPLERDGGRRLDDFGGGLWWARRGVRFDALSNHKARMTPP